MARGPALSFDKRPCCLPGAPGPPPAPAMGLPPLSRPLCLAVLCHLVALLAGEWGGLSHEPGKGEPLAPLLPLKPDIRAPRTFPG